METVHKVKFKVSLNNGETLYEGKGAYEEIPNELSPWQRLKRYILDNKLEITSISLYTDSGQTFNIPSKGVKPKFREFENVEKPLRFDMKRHLAREMSIAGKDSTEVTDLYTSIEAVYNNYTMEIWVSEIDVKNCWFLIRPN